MTTYFQFLEWGFGNKDEEFSRKFWSMVGTDDGFYRICEMLK